MRVPAPGVSLSRPPKGGHYGLLTGPFKAGHYVLVAACLAIGCSNAAVDKAAGEGAGTGIAVGTSADAVTIENHTTRPLLNVRLTITAAGSAAPFVSVLPTLDAGHTRDVRLSDFHTEDGTLLDRAMNAPRDVKVSARDTLGNTYNETAEW